jgi:lia operon protein LiaF
MVNGQSSTIDGHPGKVACGMRKNVILGLLILAIGIIYLMAEMGVLSSGAVWLSGPVLWPLVLVAAGVFGLPSRGRFSGTSVFMIVYGILLSLKDTKQFVWLNHIGGWSLFFGVAIVLVGVSFLMPRGHRWRWHVPVIVIDHDGRKKRYGYRSSRASSMRHTGDDSTDITDGSDETIDVDVSADSGSGTSGRERGSGHAKEAGQVERTKRLLGELHVGQAPWVLRDLDLWNGLGDIRVNLATAHIEDGTYTIDVAGWMGDIRVLVPEDLAVFVQASVSLGDLTVLGESHSGAGCSATVEDPNWATARQRCHIRADLLLGDIKVVRV